MALLQLGALPAGMELFPVADDEAWTLIRRVIDESDYYLLIIGGKYGSVTDEGLSFTEMEYNYAESVGKPVMAFLHGDPDELPVKKSERDQERRAKLLAFAEKVKKSKHVKFWTSAEDLAGKIALSFTSFTKSYPAVGWIRGDAGDSPTTLAALAAAQARVAELERQAETSARSGPATAAGLADNLEELELALSGSIEILNLAPATNISRTQSMTGVTGAITWNSVLAGLGPSMLDEASQRALEQRFQLLVREENETLFKTESQKWLQAVLKAEQIRDGAVGKKKPTVRVEVRSLSAATEDFEIALVQLDALGLVTQSERKRAVSDRNTYWTLTPWGRTRLKMLRAVRAGEKRPRDAEATEDEQPDATLATD